MPELPEVETVCRGLEPFLKGHTIIGVTQGHKSLRRAFPTGLSQSLKGQRVVGVRRRAKYILIDLNNNTVLLIHLGMSGRLFVKDEAYRPNSHDHLILALETGCEIVFNDARRFGQVDLIGAKDIATHPSLQGLGLEPLEKEFTAGVLSNLLAKKRTASIKIALMDQRLIAGLGNIYVCEALFRAGINPIRAANSVTGKEASALAEAVQVVLRAAIKAGGSSLRDYVDAKGRLGYFQHSFAVYGKEGKPCPACKGTIKRIVQGGRSTFYCPHCQH